MKAFRICALLFIAASSEAMPAILHAAVAAMVSIASVQGITMNYYSTLELCEAGGTPDRAAFGPVCSHVEAMGVTVQIVDTSPADAPCSSYSQEMYMTPGDCSGEPCCGGAQAVVFDPAMEGICINTDSSMGFAKVTCGEDLTHHPTTTV